MLIERMLSMFDEIEWKTMVKKEEGDQIEEKEGRVT